MSVIDNVIARYAVKFAPCAVLVSKGANAPCGGF